jgi:hypothetical protein
MCGDRLITIEDLDVGGVPIFFTTSTSQGASGDFVYFQAFGGAPKYLNYGDHNVKIRIELVNYPSIFVEHTLVVKIVCGIYDTSTNINQVIPMPNN